MLSCMWLFEISRSVLDLAKIHPSSIQQDSIDVELANQITVSVCLSVSVSLYVCLSIYLYVCLSVHPSVNMFISVCLCVRPSIRPSLHLSVWPVYVHKICIYTSPSIHACICVLIGHSECLPNVALSVPLHGSVTHGLAISGFLKPHNHTFAMTPWTRFPARLYKS